MSIHILIGILVIIANVHSKDVIFTDSTSTYFRYFDDKEKGKGCEYSTISYLSHYMGYKNKLQHVLIKINRNVTRYDGMEGQNSNIKLTFYPKYTNGIFDSFSTSKNSDDITFNVNHLITEKYGCCGSENYYEMYTLVSDELVLKYHSKLFEIDIVNGLADLYLGYEKSDDNSSHGTLHFSDGKKIISSIKFKFKNQDSYKKISHWTPKITLSSNSTKDKFWDSETNQVLQLWSKNGLKNISDLNDVNINIIFTDESEEKEKNYVKNIPIKNGHFFGDDKKKYQILIESRQ